MSDEKAEYEKRLQRRLAILLDELEKGTIRFKEGLNVVESLKAVRYSADGTIDLSTVDSVVKSLALGVEYFHNREEIKRQTSLKEIQSAYFQLLNTNFSSFYRQMIKDKANPHTYAKYLSRQPEVIKEIDPKIRDFLAVLKEMWEAYAQPAYIHVEDSAATLKGVFGGDLFPSYNENIASKCGIYLDTIILPDPFLRSNDLFRRWNAEQRIYYLFKHALNVLQYEELALADVDPPIVVILPDLPHIDEDEKSFLMRWGEQDAIVHASRVFGRQFKDSDELLDFASRLNTLDKVTRALADPGRVLADSEQPRDAKTQIELSLTAQSGLLGTKNPGLTVASMAFGRMTVSNEILLKSARLHATPVIDAPTSWEYLKWKLEYDADRAAPQPDRLSLHIVHALESMQGSEFRWIGNVPPDALIEIRQSGVLSEIRKAISAGIGKMATEDPADFGRTTDVVIRNFASVFQEHEKQIDALKKKKWKFATKDIGTWIVAGAIEIAAAATGTPLFGLLAIAVDQLLDAPKLKDIPKSLKALAEESNKIKRSPIGILFKYKKT
jgi:hypothetical protein